MIYPDLSFALSLLIEGDHSAQASALLRGIDLPLPLSILHRLQIENGLLRALYGRDPEKAQIAKNALLRWQDYLHEQVFVIESFDLEAGLSTAAAWNAASTKSPLHWSLLTHPVIAVETGAAFASFDPALRSLVVAGGGRVLPEEL